MTTLLVATRSRHKLQELRTLLAGVPALRLVDLEEHGIPDDPAEEGVEAHDTFEANALAKARFFAARSELPVVADDSGLCVDALGGAPGVRSKRFSGRADLSGEALDGANNRLLLERLRGVPLPGRTAHYRCAIALVDTGGAEHVFQGRCDGLVAGEPSGAGGFGYDPLFYVPALGATLGEVPPADKHRVSHRARAAAALAEWLRSRRRG